MHNVHSAFHLGISRNNNGYYLEFFNIITRDWILNQVTKTTYGIQRLAMHKLLGDWRGLRSDIKKIEYANNEYFLSGEFYNHYTRCIWVWKIAYTFNKHIYLPPRVQESYTLYHVMRTKNSDTELWFCEK